MNGRTRFLETLRSGTPDRVPYFEEGLREGLLSLWIQQGLPKRADLYQKFPYDRREHIELDLDPHPESRKWAGSRAELDGFRNRMDPDKPNRLPGRSSEKVHAWKSRDHILILAMPTSYLILNCNRYSRRLASFLISKSIVEVHHVLPSCAFFS
jgi:hypothetical protein